MATKKTSTIKNYRVLGKVTVEVFTTVTASDLSEAATKAEDLSYDDFVDITGELYESTKPEITSLSVD